MCFMVTYIRNLQKRPRAAQYQLADHGLNTRVLLGVITSLFPSSFLTTER